MEKGVVKTVGGLVLVRLSPQNEATEFNGEVELSYRTPQGESITQLYPISYSFPKH